MGGFDITMDVGSVEWKVVERNDDGTVKILARGDDGRYVLYPRVRITFSIDADEEGNYAKMVTKEYWDSWGKDLPEDTLTDY